MAVKAERDRNRDCCYYFPSVLWCCWLGDRKGIQPVKSWVLVCWWWRVDCSFDRVVTTRSNIVILDSNNSGMETFWYLLTQRHWKMAVKTARDSLLLSIYICQGGCVFITVCLFVCLFVCWRDYADSQLMFSKFVGKAARGHRRNW